MLDDGANGKGGALDGRDTALLVIEVLLGIEQGLCCFTNQFERPTSCRAKAKLKRVGQCNP